jgi:hypothetical protein
MTAPTSPEIDYYLERVGAALADLPQDVRDDLMEDLPAHFAEVLLEEQGGSLVDRLGPPAAYAAELRAAAGLDSGPRAKRSGIDTERIAARLRMVNERGGRLIGYERATEFLRLLRPAWWIARGVSLVALIFALDIIPTDRFDDPIGWVLVAVAVVVSVRIGATGRPQMPRWLGFVITAAAVVGALMIVVEAGRFGDYNYSSYTPSSDPYSNITDVYPVGQDGKPLENVTLYDQNGNPIVLGDPWRCGSSDQTREQEQEPARSYPMCVRPRPEPTATPPVVSPSVVSPSVANPSVSGSPSPSVSPSR